MKKEITLEQIITHKSKLRINIDGKFIDPYPYLSRPEQICIYAEEVLFSHRGYYWENPDNKTYILEDKYQGTTSDPIILKMVLETISEHNLTNS